MGYTTSFNGTFKGITPKIYKAIQKETKKGEGLLNELGFVYWEGNLEFNDCWKNYGKSIEKIAFMLARLDRKIEGTIECHGDDPEDMWKIKVINGKVRIFRAEIAYKEEDPEVEGMESDIEVLKCLYAITKDKKYNKELIVASIQKETKNDTN